MFGCPAGGCTNSREGDCQMWEEDRGERDGSHAFSLGVRRERDDFGVVAV